MGYRGLSLFIRQNQIKGGISRLAKFRKPQFTAVNEDLRDKRNIVSVLIMYFVSYRGRNSTVIPIAAAILYSVATVGIVSPRSTLEI